jgi:hypothetical protein
MRNKVGFFPIICLWTIIVMTFLWAGPCSHVYTHTYIFRINAIRQFEKLLEYLPIMHIGFRMNRSRPQKPIYLDRQPADQSRIMYSTPKKTTKQISIQKRVSLANSLYCSIVDKTLKIKHTRTSMNLWMEGEKFFI